MMLNKLKPLLLTVGEPSGIGADLLVMLAQVPPICARPLVFLADKHVLMERAKLLRLPFFLPNFDSDAVSLPPLSIWHHAAKDVVVPKVLNPNNSAHVMAMLESAVSGCLSGKFAGMVTAPIHKGVMNEAGFSFTGHTEWLAERTNTPQVVMMLVGGGLRVALATTHVPLREVANVLTPQLLTEVVEIVHRDLGRRFAIDTPTIAVASLNPHAGEGGHLGREEVEWMNDTLHTLRLRGISVSDPMPADTLFHPERLRGVDVVLAMYHDQGLPVLKYASFGSGVNVTLGLPIIRTSVDHGTAFDLVGTGRADLGSLRAAILLADKMAIATEIRGN